jgi:two-component system phosphate regulon response regulator OmpR
MKNRILIVDDDAVTRNFLSNQLEKHGFETLEAANSTEMQKQRERFQCHLLLLDVIMQGENGLSICQRLRTEGDKIPIIILSGRDETIDRVIGLEFGADDYITKPVAPRELIARVRAVLRRAPDQILNAYDTKPIKFKFGPFVLDGVSRSLLRDGQVIPLSSDELALLMIMTSMMGKPLSRNQLANLLKGSDHKFDQRNIDMLISRVRKRIEDDSSNPQYIQTVRGVGYIFINASVEHCNS